MCGELFGCLEAPMPLRPLPEPPMLLVTFLTKNQSEMQRLETIEMHVCCMFLACLLRGGFKFHGMLLAEEANTKPSQENNKLPSKYANNRNHPATKQKNCARQMSSIYKKSAQPIPTQEGGVVKSTFKKEKEGVEYKRTTPGIPTWSPTVVLTGPDDA